MSDPYVIVSFSNFSKATSVINKTRCPLWNQTLMEDDIELCGNREFITDHVPPVTVDLWDKDRLVSQQWVTLVQAPSLHGQHSAGSFRVGTA